MLSMIMALVAYYISQNNNFTTQELAEIAQVQLQKKETIAYSKLLEISNLLKSIKPKQLFLKYNSFSENLYKDEGIAIYVSGLIISQQ